MKNKIIFKEIEKLKNVQWKNPENQFSKLTALEKLEKRLKTIIKKEKDTKNKTFNFQLHKGLA